jgi:hypothetical protein
MQAAVGVEPSEQGRGIGGALMQPILTRAGVEGLPCYLETQNERNLPFYERHGFEVISDGEVPKCGLRVWANETPPDLNNRVDATRRSGSCSTLGSPACGRPGSPFPRLPVRQPYSPSRVPQAAGRGPWLRRCPAAGLPRR